MAYTGTNSLIITAYKIQADGTPSFVKGLGSYGNGTKMSVSNDATMLYVPTNIAVWKSSFNITTYASSLTTGVSGLGNVNQVVATNNGMWGNAANNLYRSGENVTTANSVAIGSSTAFLALIEGATEQVYTAINNIVKRQYQTSPTGVTNIQSGTSVNITDNATSMMSDNTSLYVTTDNHEMKIISSNLTISSTFSICSNGKVETIANSVLTVNCGTFTTLYKTDGTKIEEFDSGANPIKTIVYHL